jgi:hypothetical protein
LFDSKGYIAVCASNLVRLATMHSLWSYAKNMANEKVEVIKGFQCPGCATLLPDYAITCPGCNLDLIANAPRPASLVAKSVNKNEQSVFFYMSPLKLYVMFVATGGLYSIFWFYKNWTYASEHSQRAGNFPLLEAIFGRLTYYWLLKHVQKAGAQMAVPYTLPSGWLAIGFFLLGALDRLPYIGIVCLLLAPLMLLPVQKYINSLNTNSPTPMNSRFSVANWVGIIICGGLVLLGAIADYWPNSK